MAKGCADPAGSLATTSSEGGYLRLALLLWAKDKYEEASSMLAEANKAHPEYRDARELLQYLNAQRPE